jgi:cation diffusion facilitator family transporter
LWVLAAVIIIKEGLFRFVRRVAIDVDSGAVMADAWHHRSDVMTSLAAAIGITIALIGGERYASADDWAALVAAGIIAFNAYRLVSGPVRELMDTVPHEITTQIASLASGIVGVEGVEKVMARKHGTQYLVDMHLEVDPEMTVRASHSLAHDVKERIQAAMPNIKDVLIHIEPVNEPASSRHASTFLRNEGSS